MQTSLDALNLSPSVQKAVRRLPLDESVAAWTMAQALLQVHPEYAGGLADKLAHSKAPPAGLHQSVADWLTAVRNQYSPDVDQLNTRLTLYGLALVDRNLYKLFETDDFLAALQREIEGREGQPLQRLLRQAAPPIDEPIPEPSPTYEPNLPDPPPDPPELYRPPAPGYISDHVSAATVRTDHLSIEHEVNTIAHVLLARQVQPPLALGLFGDWGSGKSFFMSQLQRTIAAQADHNRRSERAEATACPWCSRVLQIDFNAWNYADTNLWASLVTRIYDRLDEELSEERPSDKELRDRLGQQIQQVQGKVRDSREEVTQAQKRLRLAEKTFAAAQSRRLTEQNKLNSHIDDLPQLFRELKEQQPSLDSDLNTAADALGYPEAKKSYEALVDLNTNLKSFSGRLSALTLNLLQSPPWTLLLLALLIVLLPLAVGFLLQQLGDGLSMVGQRVAEVSTFLVGLIAWLKLQIGRGLRLVGNVEEALTAAQRVRQQRLTAEGSEAQQAQQNLAVAQAEEEAARTNLQSAQTELQRLKSELEELRPERKLYRLIEERARTAAYSQYLGIISLIRADFEQISGLLEEMIAEERDLSQEEPPIQRIILYIDDLDRCRPERVVEVLEAVHLLLAFPLFVVVVGVDPRWLRHALAHHYAQTLSSNGDAPASPLGGVAAYATPQDYLEKIFQIPFALRPVAEDGYKKLVGDLLQPLPETALSAPPVVNGGTAVSTPDPSADHSPSGAGAAGPTDQPPPDPPISEPPSRLNPQQLDFTDWEEADIDHLWPLFTTPRSIKRFINIYRLVRAGLPTEGDVTAFAGTADQPGTYQLVLLLLAVVTAFPNQTARFHHHLQRWLADERPEAATGRWSELLTALRAAKASDNADWNRLLDALEQVTAARFTQPFRYRDLHDWSWRIARYSFSLA